MSRLTLFPKFDVADSAQSSPLHPGPTSTMSDSEKPFKLSVSDADLELLQKKLALTILPSELDDAGWPYGVPLAHIKRLLEH